MEKYCDFNAADFLNDDHFLKWITDPDKEENDFWNDFQKKHPYKKAQIKEARLIFKLFHSREEKLGLNESYELWSRIQRESRTSPRTLMVKFFKYAAILLLVFLSGGISYFFVNQFEKPHFLELTEIEQTESNEARIILSDGSEVPLENQLSEISYSNNGQQLIINNDTIRQHSGSQKEQINKVIIPYGKKSMIQLSDGTKVWLNAGSQLIYPSQFIHKTRQVMLIGEAYFDVAKNSDKPFIVRASDIYVHVHGTKFDISAYPEDKMVSDSA